jgi:hypothetical protein
VTAGNEGQDLLDAGALSGDSSGKAVASLLGEPSRRRAVARHGGVDNESLSLKVGEAQTVAGWEPMTTRERDQAGLPGQDLDLEIGLPRFQSREREVDPALEDVLQATEEQLPH